MSDKDRWGTPPDLFARLSMQYGPFTLDAAADSRNHLLPRWYGPGGVRESALTSLWTGETYYCNPPYSDPTPFVLFASISLARTVLLLPATTDVAWFHEYVYHAPNRTIEFLRGRVRFIDPSTGKPGGTPRFGSMVVVFN